MKKKIAVYEILEEISRGATTVVYKAFQPSLERVILLKVLHENLANETDIVGRFQREAKACAKIEHENIINVFDYGLDQGSHYIAMEFVEGISIEQLLKKAKIIPLEIVIFIIIEVLKGLAFTHSKEIYHRDIKPANILLSFQGKVKITDFGLAIIANYTKVTIQNAILGTPAYMSPEQIAGQKLDGRTDIFSAGATFYEMLTNKQAFAGKTYSESLNNILNNEPPRLEKIRPDVPPEIAAIIKTMLSKKPARRFETCESVLTKLISFVRQNKLSLTRQNFRAYIKDHESYVRKEFKPKTGNIRTIKNAANNRITWAIVVVLFVIAISFSIDHFSAEKRQSLQRLDNLLDSLSLSALENHKLINAEPEKDLLIPPKKQAEKKLPESADKAEAAKLQVTKVTTPEIKKQLSQNTFVNREATLVIRCAPWAEILVDGQYQKTLYESDSLTIKAKPGSYRITLINPDFAPYDTAQQVIKLAPGEIKRKRIPFIEAAKIGFLKVMVKPWARVYVDGEYKGTTPLKPMIIKHGKYILKLEHPQAAEWEEQIVIKTGETSEIQADLTLNPQTK